MAMEMPVVTTHKTPGRKQRYFAVCKFACVGALLSGLGLGLGQALAFDPATDHKCVWNCDAPSGGRTITIWIEQPPQMGPPTIVWRRPSSAGSSQTNFTSIDNAAMKQGLDIWSKDNSWQIYGKAKNALSRGDCNTAAAYLQEALRRNPRPNELADIQSSLQEANSCIKRFRKSPDTLALTIGIEDDQGRFLDKLFDPARHDLEAARQQLLPLLLEQEKSKAAFSKLNELVEQAEALAKSQPNRAGLGKLESEKAERDKAELEMKAANEAVKTKTEEVKQTYRLE